MTILKSKLILVALVLIIGWLSLSLVKIKLQNDIVNKEVVDLESKIENLEDSNSSLDKLIAYLKHPFFLDKEVRLKLNYKSPDEEVAFIYPDTSAKISSGSLNFDEQLARLPNYVKWFWYLMGR